MNTTNILNISTDKLTEQFRQKLGKTVLHHKGMLKDFCIKNCPYIEKTKKGFICPMFLCPRDMKRKYNAYLLWGRKKLKQTELRRHYNRLKQLSMQQLTILKKERQILIHRSEKTLLREMAIRWNLEKKRVNIVKGYCKNEILRMKAHIERLERFNEELAKRVETFAVPEIAAIALQSIQKEVTEYDQEIYKVQKIIEFAENAIKQGDKYNIELSDLSKRLQKLYDERGKGWTNQKLTRYMKELERRIDNNLEYPRNDENYPEGRRGRPRIHQQNSSCTQKPEGN